MECALGLVAHLAAFVTVVVYSPEYFYRILDHNQNVGLPSAQRRTDADGQIRLVLYGTLAIGTGYVGNLIWRLATGQKVSFPKVAVMGTTIFLIYFGWIYIQDLTIGYAAFAAFHDIQYFAIVWVYNNNLVQRQEKTSRLLKTFFHESVDADSRWLRGHKLYLWNRKLQLELV